MYFDVKEATLKRFHYDNCGQLEGHPESVLATYNVAPRLKSLTLYEFVYKCQTSEPERVTLHPIQEMLGLKLSR